MIKFGNMNIILLLLHLWITRISSKRCFSDSLSNQFCLSDGYNKKVLPPRLANDGIVHVQFSSLLLSDVYSFDNGHDTIKIGTVAK